MTAYYNEIEPYAAEWLRNLIARNLIAPGDVDTRSIVDVQPDDLRGYTQCHFFAGIGGWSYALRLAGWPDDRSVWSGSCPCQPFSTAGKQRGSEDERHLWPAFFRLIRECRPATVFGEQVAGAAGLAWLDHVCADLEGEGYAAAAADLPACSVGAPHRRQRLWWVAHSTDVRSRSAEGRRSVRTEQSEGRVQQLTRACDVGMVAHANRTGSLLGECDSEPQQPGQPAPCRHDADGCGAVCGVGNSERIGQQGSREMGRSGDSTASSDRQADRIDDASYVGHWDDLEWLPCSDGKARPTQPGLFPLADGLQSCLVRCGDIEAAAIQEVLDAKIDTNPSEALRTVWQVVRAQIHQRQAGGSRSIHQAEILLPFLLSLRSAFNASAFGRGGPQASKAIHWRALRFLRVAQRVNRSSCQWQSERQQAREYTDAVRILSLKLARHAEAFEVAAKDAHASTDRVGRLRAYGNAIVAPLAAEFIGAVMDARP